MQDCMKLSRRRFCHYADCMKLSSPLFYHFPNVLKVLYGVSKFLQMGLTSETQNIL